MMPKKKFCKTNHKRNQLRADGLHVSQCCDLWATVYCFRSSSAEVPLQAVRTSKLACWQNTAVSNSQFGLDFLWRTNWNYPLFCCAHMMQRALTTLISALVLCSLRFRRSSGFRSTASCTGTWWSATSAAWRENTSGTWDTGGGRHVTWCVAWMEKNTVRDVGRT